MAVRSWSTAVPDWEDKIRSGRTPLPDGLPLNEVYADRALAIFKRLRVPDVPGKPTFGEVSPDWVFDLVRAVFGSYDPETRSRILREFFLLIPKKNGKSTISAAIIVVAAILNDRPAAELVLISSTDAVSQITFSAARGIIQADQTLAQLFRIQSHLKTITHQTTEATIRILSADGDVVTGSKAAFVLIDELHVLGAKPKADEIMTELRGGLAARPEGFLLIITTQSKTEPSGQFKAELMHARAVRDGKTSYPMLAILYELPREMQQSQAWLDPATWGLVNPSLNVSVREEFLREEMDRAREKGPDALALFASQHLNIEVGLGLHNDRWPGAEYWEARVDAQMIGLDELMARAEVVVVGGDCGGADDLMALSLIGRDRDTRCWLAWTHAWCAPAALDRRKEIAPRLRDFEADGDLTIDKDVDQHVRDFADICDRLRDARLLPAEAAIGLDPWGVAALRDELLSRGYTPDQVVGVSQGWKLVGAIKGLERRLLQGTFVHCGQPLLRWSVGNAKYEARGNNVYITKAQAGTAKIDPLIALFNAAQLMDMNPAVSVAATPWDLDPNYRMAG